MAITAYLCEYVLLPVLLQFIYISGKEGEGQQQPVQVEVKEDVEELQKVEGEGEEQEPVEEEQEKVAPPGEWWGRIYTFDEVSELVDQILPKKYKK